MSGPEAEFSQASSTAVSPPHSLAASRQNAIPAAAATGHEDKNISASGVPVAPGAAIHVVQPSTYLRRPRAISRPMTPAKPLSSVDREQIDGLVSAFAIWLDSAWERDRDVGFACCGLSADCRITAPDQSLSQGPYQLRCTTVEFPLDCL